MPAPIVVICRRASDPLTPGSVLGYKCENCPTELQLSPAGRQQVRENLDHRPVFLCMDCGTRAMEIIQAKMQVDPEVEMDVRILPRAAEQMRELGMDPNDLFRKPR